MRRVQAPIANADPRSELPANAVTASNILVSGLKAAFMITRRVSAPQFFPTIDARDIASARNDGLGHTRQHLAQVLDDRT